MKVSIAPLLLVALLLVATSSATAPADDPPTCPPNGCSVELEVEMSACLPHVAGPLNRAAPFNEICGGLAEAHEEVPAPFRDHEKLWRRHRTLLGRKPLRSKKSPPRSRIPDLPPIPVIPPTSTPGGAEGPKGVVSAKASSDRGGILRQLLAGPVLVLFFLLLTLPLWFDGRGGFC